MRIKEISIQRYGPLATQFFSTPENFILIYGPNEAGKSLTVDALVKFFFDKAREIKKIIEFNKDRVDQKPEGYVLIERDGNDFKLPEHGTLFDLLEISAEDCRNVFVVRASELGLKDEKSFFDSVMGKLLGLETEKIKKVAEELKKIGKLLNASSSSELSDAALDGKAKSRIERAANLILRITGLEKKAAEEGLDNIEKSFVELEEKRTLSSSQINEQEAAREREQYHKGRKALEAINNCVHSLENLNLFTEEEQRTWENAEQRIAQIASTITSLKSELDEAREKTSRIEGQIAAIEDEMTELRHREGMIEAFELSCREYGRELEKMAQSQTAGKTLRAFGLASFGAFLIAAIVVLSNDGLAWTILASVSFSSFLVLAIWYAYKVAMPSGSLSGKFERLRQDAVNCGLVVESTFDRILAQIVSHRNNVKSKQNDLQKRNTELGIVRIDVESKESDLQKHEEESSRLKGNVESTRSRSGVTLLSLYSDKLSEKTKLQAELSQNESALNTLWTSPATDLKSRVQFWKEKIENLRPYENASPAIIYDEVFLRGYKDNLQAYDSEIAVIGKSLEDWQTELTEIAMQVTDVIGDGNARTCYSLSGLGILLGELQAFESSTKEAAELARTAIAVLEKIRVDEDQKVISLFGDGTRAADFFKQITDGRYVDIMFDASNAKLRVKNSLGDEIDSGKLSSGASDQLFFAIRLALAERILGEKGFFILDDPFIRSDLTRLKNQLLILKNFASQGWQFIYFSAKGEVRELFEAEIGIGNANLIEFPNQ